MSQRCVVCKDNPNVCRNLFQYELPDFTLRTFCTHGHHIYEYDKFMNGQLVSIDDSIHVGANLICGHCVIKLSREQRYLPKLHDWDIIKIAACFKWKAGENDEQYCWTKDLPLCDAQNCNYFSVTDAKIQYADRDAFIVNAQELFQQAQTNLLLDILDIVFEYAYNIKFGKNGLCSKHSLEYKHNGAAYVFSTIPECEICYTHISNFNRDSARRYSDETRKVIDEVRNNVRWFNGLMTLHHEPMELCCKNATPYKQNCVMIGHDYRMNRCRQLCIDFDTWCEKCNKCISHDNLLKDKENITVTNYPHCDICGYHSKYQHCLKCDAHSEWPHCNECNRHVGFDPHCDICGAHSVIAHCDKCWNNGHNYVHHIGACQPGRRKS